MLKRKSLDRHMVAVGDYAGRLWRLYGLPGAATLVALATVIYTVVTVFRLHILLPVWDEWAWVSDLSQVWAGTYDWTELVRPHNEHRIAFPRLVMLADAYFFAMSGWFVLTVTFLLQALNATLLIRLMIKAVNNVSLRVAISSLIVIVLFSLRQRENLDNVFQVQFVGVYTAAIAAVMCYSEAQARYGESRLAASIFFAFAAAGCFVATYTMANGVMTGFVLVILALLMRSAWKLVAATLVFSVLLSIAFFYHYLTPEAPSAGYISSHIGRYAAYFIAYFGNPFSTKPLNAQIFGTLGLLAFFAAAWWVATLRAKTVAHAALLGIAGFIVATGCTTVYGRASLGISQALESRYVTPVSLFWCALICFWAPILIQADRHRKAWLGHAWLVVSIAALTTSSIWFELTTWPKMSSEAAVFRQFHDSLQTRLFDTDLTAKFENWPDEEIRVDAEFLRKARLSLYAEPQAAYLGRHITDIGLVTDQRACSGAIALAESDARLGNSGVRLKGFAHAEHRGAIRSIVLTNDESVVVGYGSLDRPAGPPGEWLGYARSATNTNVQAFGVMTDGRFCHLGTAVAVAP